MIKRINEDCSFDQSVNQMQFFFGADFGYDSCFFGLEDDKQSSYKIKDESVRNRLNLDGMK